MFLNKNVNNLSVFIEVNYCGIEGSYGKVWSK